MLVTVGAAQGDAPGPRQLQAWDFHFLTPESENTTHYFYATRDNFIEADAEHVKRKLAGMLAAFEFEDGPIVGAIQQEMADEDFWSLKPVLLTSDPGPVRAERLLEKLIHDEQAAAPGVALA
jgi:hypothetical protein